MKHKWIGYTEWVAQKTRGESGVYALVAGTEIRKLKDHDAAGILYFGGSDDLHDRLRKTGEDLFSHSVLWYVLSSEGHSPLRPVELPDGTVNQEHPKWPHYSRVDDPKLSQPGLWVLPIPESSEGDEISWKNLEKLLLIKHFFQFGQYPPFNADCPSIKSIYDHWENLPGNKPGWGELWKAVRVDEAWDDLVNNATMGKPERK